MITLHGATTSYASLERICSFGYWSGTYQAVKQAYIAECPKARLLLLYRMLRGPQDLIY